MSRGWTWLSLRAAGSLALVAVFSVASAAHAQLEDPEWAEGDDHPAQLEHDAEAAAAAAEAEVQRLEAEAARLQAEAEAAEAEVARMEAAEAAEAARAADARRATAVGPAPDAQDDCVAAEEPTSERRIRLPLLELGAIGALLYQHLTYRDDLYGFMRPYSLNSAKEFGGYVAAYPLARADMGALGGLGVELRYTHMLTFDSVRADGSTFPTRAQELVTGFRYRFDQDALLNRGIDASVGVGGGRQIFDIGSAIALPNVDNRAAVPSRHYRFLRLDAATRVTLDLGFFVTMHIGARLVTDAGDVDTAAWFPRGRRWGLESGLHLGYVLPQNIELSVGFEAQRYMYRLRPQPGDPNIVGGLLDRYVHAQVRAGWRY